MAKYLIHAMEGRFQGLHGIESLIVVEYDNIDDVYEDASYHSEEVMTQYGGILEEIEEDADYLCQEWFGDDYTTDQFDDVYWELITENKLWYIYKIRDEITLSCAELENKAFHLGANIFIEEFCYPDTL